MKKRKIKLLSSILGVFAICGLFGLSILYSKNAESVNAVETTIEQGVNTQGLNEFSYYDENYGQVIRFMNDESLYRFNYVTGTNNGEIYYRLFYEFGYKKFMFGTTSHVNSDGIENRNFISEQEFNRTEMYVTSVNYYYDEYESFGNQILVDSALRFNYYIKYGMYENGDFTWYETTDTLTGEGATLSLFIPVANFPYNANSFESVHAFDVPILVNVTEYTSMIYDYNNGYELGYSDGFVEGSSQAYTEATVSAYNLGYDIGYTNGINSQQSLIQNAYNEGYAQGYASGSDSDSTVASIFSGILQVGMLPVNFFLSIFNFEILGINLSAFVSALLTIAVTIVVVRIVIGSKNG